MFSPTRTKDTESAANSPRGSPNSMMKHQRGNLSTDMGYLNAATASIEKPDLIPKGAHVRNSSLAVRTGALNDLRKSHQVPSTGGLQYKVSVAEMVSSSKRNGGDQELGVPGMETKRLLVPNLEKPNSFNITKEHAIKKDYMSVL